MAVIARDSVTLAVAVDVERVDVYYKLQASTATAPSKPTTASPSGWTTIEPDYDGTTTNTLYTCQKTTLTDGTFYWSAVSKSSSYEAAKQAANAAAANATSITTITQNYNNLVDTVGEHSTTIGTLSTTYTTKTEFANLQIGGRNLLRWTAEPEYSETSWNKDPSTMAGWARWSTNATITNTSDGIKIENTSTANTGLCIPLVYENAVVGGVEYTLSFKYKSNSTTLGDIYLLCQSGGNVLVSSNAITASTDAWQHYEQVITWPSTSGKNTRALLIPYFANGKWLEICNGSMQLEKGNKATDWTPAPEDLEAYADTQIASAESRITQTTDAITSEVSKITSYKYVNSSTASWTLANIQTYAAEGHPENWNVSSTANLRVGDTVYVKGTDSTRSCTVYIKTTVTAVNSATNFTGTSHGYEDVLPVQSIKSTINQSADSVKIQANHVEIDGTTVFRNSSTSTTTFANYVSGVAQDAVDDVEIGGRNLLRNTAIARSEAAGQYGAWGVLKPTYSNPYLLDLDEGDYVLSFDWSASSALPSAFYVWIGYGNSSGDGSAEMPGSSNGVYYGTGETSGHIVRKFYWPDANSTYPYFSCRPFRSQSTNGLSGITFTVTNAMLEKGNKPTDWQPAPEDLALASDSVEYIEGTQTASTGSWTGVTRDSALYSGKTIAYKLPYAGSGNASLQLKDSAGNNVGGNIAVYSMTTRVTTHYPAGSVIQMTYDGTYWRTAGWYNTNNFDRVQHNTAVKAQVAIPQYVICCGTASGYRKLEASTTFDLGYPLLYLNAANVSNQTYAVAASGTSTNFYDAFPNVTFTNNGSITSATSYSQLFLKGTISGNTFTVAASGFMTCTVPSSEDGYFYIPLGVLKSTTQGFFTTSKDLYAYLDGKFRQVTPTEIVASQRIYYRTSNPQAPTTSYLPTAWVTETGNKWSSNSTTVSNWSTKVTPIADSTDEDETRYLYLYTCEQRKRLDGTLAYTAVLLDESTTVIDGGNIITNSISANKINANLITVISNSATLTNDLDGYVRGISYVLTNDSTAQSGKQYFTRSETTVYGLSEAVVGSSASGLYELSGVSYVPTSDTTVLSGKEYYEAIVKYEYDVYEVADGGSVSGKYEIERGNSLADRLLGVSDDVVKAAEDVADLENRTFGVNGLSQQVSTIGSELRSAIKIDPGSGAVSVGYMDANEVFQNSHAEINANGFDVYYGSKLMAHYGQYAAIGNLDGAHMQAEGDHLGFYDKNNHEVAYIDVDDNGESVFYMTRSVVVKDMFFGDGKWKWYKRSNNNMGLKWMGGE